MRATRASWCSILSVRLEADYLALGAVDETGAHVEVGEKYHAHADFELDERFVAMVFLDDIVSQSMFYN